MLLCFLWRSLNNIFVVNLFVKQFDFVITEIVVTAGDAIGQKFTREPSEESLFCDGLKIVRFCYMHSKFIAPKRLLNARISISKLVLIYMEVTTERFHDFQADSLWCGVKGKHNNQKLLSLINRGHACVHTKIILVIHAKSKFLMGWRR